MNTYTFATTEGGELTAGLQLPNLDAAAERAQKFANDLAVVVEYWDDRAPSDAYECEPESDGPMSREDALSWAREAESGDYLAEYEDDGLDAVSDPGNRCGYDDETLDAVGRVLRERGLVLRANDRGLVVEEVV